MCEILLAILEIIVNFSLGFSIDLANTISEIGYGFLSDYLGCRVPPVFTLPG